MFSIVLGLLSIVCAWRWGDWKNWSKYLSTIQYFIIGDLLYNMFTLNYPLWSYPNPPNLLPSHIINNLYLMLTIYPSSILIFLYRYPKENLIRKFLYILSWILLWLVFEFFMVRLGYCVYSHGWTYGWSILFVCTMVPMLLLHSKRPILAYVLSVPIIVFLLLWFQVPI